ncbi:hypothetical protein JOF41_002801 [Saccharothrix coeruleofusca]|uniref:winged helix DNA-binding domain-containing protein n=1 Tax=Saccharothrix coeruleofusca TaxID=33919 RepID=UPI001AE5AE96|nr:winged helix DNA-binding domain-containing protein [Saccharothrix coeruleofusca]MBP2336623.1 hypothetical protein [Saccharothrix coeruleofusca]
MSGKPITTRALNRALLARQGLLEPLALPVVAAVEAIGAIQAQSWAAPPVALWSRLAGFRAEDLHAALAGGELVAGTLLRATLHVVSAAQHADYAVVAERSGACDWRRAKGEPHPDSAALRPAVAAFAADEPRSVEEISAFAEQWAAARPGVVGAEELAFQREHKWRPLRTGPFLVRVPGDGRWAKEPKHYRAAPPVGQRATEAALDAVVSHHLRAFGPATVEDVAYWTGWSTPGVRESLERLGDTLVRFTDEAGRQVHDLVDAPRPDEGVRVGPRFLAAFDSALLAYHAQRRERVLPEAHRDAVSVRANLQIKPTFLLDGVVAGLWSSTAKRRTAVLTLTPFAAVKAADRRALTAQGERLLEFLHPGCAEREVVLAG